MKGSSSSQYSHRSDYEDDEAAPPPSFPPSMREGGFQYDVFLSFRGRDTRKGFTSHLYKALQDKGIHTFIDSEKLEKGQKVKELFGYIERSKIFVPIFSQGYADSLWCLKEITKMVECKRLIIPIFFDVEPRDVRHQSGPFAPAFSRYSENDITNKEEVREWRNALIEAGQVSGYTLANTCVDEAIEIKKIVKRILTEVNRAPLFIGTTHSIGLDSRTEELVKVLEVEALNIVKMVGIHGMGGIGKTTLARAVYNQLFLHFDACSFISDVREAAEQSKLVSLQEQLLRDVLKDENVKVNDTAHGTGMIVDRIKHMKVLLVLDDVDSESQLSALAGSEYWIRPGSRIIITSRDKQVLRASGVKESEVYELKELNPSQSLQLFSWHAFRKEEPLPESAELSKEVANTAAGLPLALKVFGSHFFYLQTNKERENMLKKLKKDQHKDIHERLKISFDALGEEEKIVFLDIACFFIGKKRDFATFKWEDCRLFPDITIKFLMHKSLININEYTGEFEMHDHIRDMGRKIVEDESRSDPGLRSRLWKKDDILYALQNKRGTEKIEAIDISCLSIDPVDVDVESFEGMSQLRMLRLENVTLGGEYGHFPRTLKWLNWNPQYLDSLPSTLPLENIAVLDLSESSITEVWNNHGFRETKVFGQLKVLNLKKCKKLTICPDFTAMQHLEILDFDGCVSMTELHPSIGYLKSLTRLNLRCCSSLKELPKEVWQLTLLEVLDVSNCYRITAFPSQLMDSKSLKRPLLGKLKVMILDSCKNLTSCPDFTCMTYIENLDFTGCEKLTELHPSIGHLKSLTHLSLRGCESLKELPEGVWQLTSLEVLDVCECSQITTLSSQLLDSKSLKRPMLGKLKVMNLYFCKNLTICPDFMCMPNIENLEFTGCEKLTKLHPSIGHLKSLTHLNLSCCSSLKELPEGVCQLASLEELDLSMCYRITTLSPQLLDSMSLKQPLLRKLKVMHLYFCKNLTICPDFTCMPHLEKLDLGYCANMTELHPSIGHLKNLTHLCLMGCRSLKELPEVAWQLTSLKTLDLRYCCKVATLPSQLGKSGRLKQLFLDGTVITALPESMRHLMQLNELSITGCKQIEFLPQVPCSVVKEKAAGYYEMEVKSPPSSSPPPMKEGGFQYDVFLSFRARDTHKGFTRHLYQALQDKGIHTFIDSEKLEKGQKVKELFGYIERSQIFVPIFSQGYADSKWCLKEITKMVECKRLIIPVFFDVKPRDVRGQSGPFEPAFTRYGDKTNKEEVREWRNALIEAGQVSGYTLANTCVDEATEIKKIVKRIMTEVNNAPLLIRDTHLIGLDSRMAELVEVLELESQNDVKMVGIHGMGGIGKTTLARAVYNQLFLHFDACSFISDVREAAKQSKLVSLQEQLLCDVLKDENVEVNDTAHGTGMIMDRLKHKKVLLVLDDVDSESQLGALAGSEYWFRPGSRIIITCRDKQVLIEPPTLTVENAYEVKELDSAQALQLFSWHAFGKEEPPAKFAKLSREVAASAAGLPLALKIFGRHFFYQKTNKQREAMMKKLKKDQHKDIHERLKISFDALDKEEKIVFLDIACFFISQKRYFATFMWEERELFPDLAIKVLMHRCLVNINEYTGEFEMHDHIRDMGRKIVEDESRSDPGLRSRLWKKEDILYVLQNISHSSSGHLASWVGLDPLHGEDPNPSEEESFTEDDDLFD